ncbi:hypothetical protein BGZ61DRAFT_498055 [Ilyonectria robusta]|uniref:uncharacterized protein n=1 Tax=Ilyonectria robusta TaxID=1079257 RepID=UPI001E8D9EE6|nr:uncharacterized protein BGZ61DRAFT_498055 [Ilyonectria robusta]KAH8669191.1 hypothetical protein BGZ61DRAFT_498055 [Ilyonectria robusta]
MVSIPKPDNEQASNPPTPTSYLDSSDSQSSEYTDVPSEYFDCYILGGRAMPANVAGASCMPVDDTAQRSSLLLHQLWSAMNDGKFYSSPTSHPRRVMDIGSGTALGRCETRITRHFAMQNQRSQVIAIDKSPFMPQHVIPNLDMIREDLNLALPSEESTTDLIFLRQLCGLTTADLRDFDIRGQIMLPLYEGLGFTLPQIELLAMSMRQDLAEDMEFESFSVYAQKPP